MVVRAVEVAIALAVLYVIVSAASQPGILRVERSTVVQASADEVFARINDLRRWSEWAPFEKKDPQMRRSYGRVAHGKDAVYSWSGANQAGAGRIEITESVPPSRVVVKAHLSDPVDVDENLAFRIVPEGEATRVTWTMIGATTIGLRLLSVFVDLDRRIGKDFENGLANLRFSSEAARKAPVSAPLPGNAAQLASPPRAAP